MILGIETATRALSVALVENGRLLASILVQRGNLHDELLLPVTSQLFQDAQADWSGVAAVAVSAGPGSFTGLRIGMAAAKGIAMSRNIPLVAVPTFDALALHIAGSGIPAADATLVTAFDARGGDVYAARYEIHGGTMQRAAGPLAGTLDTILPGLPDGTWLAGDAAAAQAALSGGRYRALPGTEAGVHAGAVALLGERLHAEGRHDSIDECEPQYLREFRTTTPKIPGR